jgi:hypothetical protein
VCAELSSPEILATVFLSSSFSFVSVWFWAPPSPLPCAHNVWSYCIANAGDFQLDCRATWVFVNGVPAGMANARCCDKHNASSSSQSKRRFSPPSPKKRSPPWFGICVRSLAVQEVWHQVVIQSKSCSCSCVFK